MCVGLGKSFEDHKRSGKGIRIPLQRVPGARLSARSSKIVERSVGPFIRGSFGGVRAGGSGGQEARAAVHGGVQVSGGEAVGEAQREE